MVSRVLQKELIEACTIGNLERATQLISIEGVDVNTCDEVSKGFEMK
jgi:hypothetical protein